MILYLSEARIIWLPLPFEAKMGYLLLRPCFLRPNRHWIHEHLDTILTTPKALMEYRIILSIELCGLQYEVTVCRINGKWGVYPLDRAHKETLTPSAAATSSGCAIPD